MFTRSNLRSLVVVFFFSSRRRHTRSDRDWSSDVCSSDLYIYDPKTNWRGGEIAGRQVGGYDMARRLEDVRKEGIDKQLLFPTQITIATSNRSEERRVGKECRSRWSPYH